MLFKIPYTSYFCIDNLICLKTRDLN